MGLFRNDDDDSAIRFQLRERLLSVGDDYWIEDDSGQRRFKVDGKAMRIRDTWVLEDASGAEIARIRERKLTVRDSVKIEVGDREAVVKKALVGLRDRFHVEVDGGPDLKVQGKIADHEYKVERDGDVVAVVSKKWFRIRDSYGIEIRDPSQVVLLLAVAVAVDALAHDRG